MLKEDEELTVRHYQQYSMAWMEASDAVLVVPGSENSKGTAAEIARADQLMMPVYYSLEELKSKEPT
jgi:predicted Rossmann-fold nucleotide-binding protein